MTLSSEWLQSVASSNRIYALKPGVAGALLPSIEIHLRGVIEQAYKYTRRGKSTRMTVHDLNQALTNAGAEPLFGLIRSSSSVSAQALSAAAAAAAAAEATAATTTATTTATAATTKTTSAKATKTATATGKAEDSTISAKTSTFASSSAELRVSKGSAATSKVLSISLVDIAKQPLPPCPLQAEMSLHWLAVDGTQPQIPENPRVLDVAENQEQLQLPKEMRQFYYRVTSILLRRESEDSTCRVVLATLQYGAGLQELLPHLSQFIQREVRANARSLRVLRCLVAAMDALWANPFLSVEFHLQQMLPAAFTCILAAKLCSASNEDHWTLRARTAKSIANVLKKFRSLFPDLLARVCRTYIDALAPDRALATVCGGIMGLTALGNDVVRVHLLPCVPQLLQRIDEARADPKSQAILLAADRISDALTRAVGRSFIQSCQLGINEGWCASAQVLGDTGEELNGADARKAKKRRTELGVGRTPESVRTLEAVGLEESLVQFYGCSAREASYLRMVI